ncbi:Agrin [Paragonimus kellicotti]|nr:Agrin [Paragonimus kellicotti]
MYLWNVLSTLLVVLSVIQLTADAVCLSKEQFLASLDRTKTLVFEATLIQHTTNSPLPDGFEAYVEIRRIVQQPQVGWQLTPGSVAHIRNIRPREVDHSLCLPTVRNGDVYLWVTWNMAEDTQTREEGSLQFYPGGLFRSETSITDPRWAGDKSE